MNERPVCIEPHTASAIHAGARFLLAAGIAFAILVTAAPDHLVVNGDTVRDLTQARTCAEGECALAGSGTSGGGLRQGGLWIIHLAALDRAGVAPDGALRLSLALAALSLGLLAVVVAARFGPAAGLLSATFGAAFLAVGGDVAGMLWNPTLLATFGTALCAALLLAAANRAPAAWLATALAFALALQSHVFSAFLAPGLAAAYVVCRPRRPVATGLAAAGIGAASLASLSLESVRSALDSASLSSGALQTPPAPAPVFVPLLVLAALAAATALWIVARRLPPPARSAARALALTTGLHVGVVAAAIAWFGWPLEDRYLLPAAPGLGVSVALLATLGAARALRPLAPRPRAALGLAGLTAAVVAALALAHLGRPLPVARALRFVDLAPVAAGLRALGISSCEDAVARLRGPAAFDILTALPLALPPAAPAAAAAPASDAAPSETPPGEAAPPAGGAAPAAPAPEIYAFLVPQRHDHRADGALPAADPRGHGTAPPGGPLPAGWWTVDLGGRALHLVPRAVGVAEDGLELAPATPNGRCAGPYRPVRRAPARPATPGYPALEGAAAAGRGPAWCVRLGLTPVADAPVELRVPRGARILGAAGLATVPPGSHPPPRGSAPGAAILRLAGGQAGRRGTLEVFWPHAAGPFPYLAALHPGESAFAALLDGAL